MGADMEVHLQKVTHRNLRELTALSVSGAQGGFVASNTWSVMETYTTVKKGGVALPFGVYAGHPGRIPDDRL